MIRCTNCGADPAVKRPSSKCLWTADDKHSYQPHNYRPVVRAPDKETR